MSDYIQQYFQNVREITEKISAQDIDAVLKVVRRTQEQAGRIFFIGVGGSAANASHAVNDFRKIAGIECYTPADNVAELTARINDQGWEHCFVDWLKVSRLGAQDLVFVFSVGGGNAQKNVSVNLIKALEYAKAVGAKICGIVGKDGGFTKKTADACILIPEVSAEKVTPLTEAFQAVLWHLLVSHPDLKKNPMKWESIR